MIALQLPRPTAHDAKAIAFKHGEADGGPATSIQVGVVAAHAIGGSQFAASKGPPAVSEAQRRRPITQTALGIFLGK